MTLDDDPNNAAAQEGGNTKGVNLHKRKLPTIPDLRFEYSYLKSLQPFVKITRVGKTKTHEDEVIEVKWGWILWVTLKDQVLQPFVQGTIWGLGSLCLRPLSTRLGFRGTKSVAERVRKDGEGVSWLRNFWQGLKAQSQLR